MAFPRASLLLPWSRHPTQPPLRVSASYAIPLPGSLQRIPCWLRIKHKLPSLADKAQVNYPHLLPASSLLAQLPRMVSQLSLDPSCPVPTWRPLHSLFLCLECSFLIWAGPYSDLSAHVTSLSSDLKLRSCSNPLFRHAPGPAFALSSLFLRLPRVPRVLEKGDHGCLECCCISGFEIVHEPHNPCLWAR